MNIKLFGWALLIKSLWWGLLGTGIWSKIIKTKYLMEIKICHGFREGLVGRAYEFAIWSNLNRVQHWFKERIY